MKADHPSNLEQAATFLLHAGAHLLLAHYFHPGDTTQCPDCQAIRLLQKGAVSLAMDWYRADKTRKQRG